MASMPKPQTLTLQLHIAAPGAKPSMNVAFTMDMRSAAGMVRFAKYLRQASEIIDGHARSMTRPGKPSTARRRPQPRSKTRDHR